MARIRRPAIAFELSEYETSTKVLDSFAWPGGYPIVYLLVEQQGVDELCPDCANALLFADCPPFDTEKGAILHRDINWEDDSRYCIHCNVQLECAYPPDPDGE